MVERESLGPGTFRVKTAKGDATWKALAPDVVLVRYTGHAEAPLFDAIAAEFARVLAEVERAYSFVDLEDLTGYDPEFWAHAQEWLGRNKDRLAGGYVLQKSHAVQMGIKLLNLFVGDVVKAFTRRSEFEKQLRRCVEQRG